MMKRLIPTLAVAAFCMGAAQEFTRPAVPVDQESPGERNVRGCLWVSPGSELQQSVTCGVTGRLDSIDIRVSHDVDALEVGVMVGKPWLDDVAPATMTVLTDVSSADWTNVSLGGRDIQVFEGDTITIVVRAIERTCIGYTAYPSMYPGGELFQDGRDWDRCRSTHEGDLDFRTHVLQY